MKRNTSLVVALGMCLVLLLAALPFMGACAEEAAPAPAPAPAAPAPAPAGPQTITPTTPAAPAPAAPAKPEKVYEFSLAHYMGATLPHAIDIEHWVDRVEERSGGQIDIRIYPGQTLLPSNNTWPGVAKGIADIGFCWRYETFGKDFQEYIGFFMVGTKNNISSTTIYWECLEKFPELRAEWSENKLLVLSGTDPYHMHNAVRVLKTPADAKGLQIRCSGKPAAKTVELWGATGVFAPITEAYEMLQKNTVDGILCGTDALQSFRFGEVLKSTSFVNGPMGTGLSLHMNMDSWNSLTPDLQKIMEEEAVTLDLDTKQTWLDTTANAVNFCKEVVPGYVFYEPTEAELDEWHAPLLPTYKIWATEVDAKGLPGTELYNFVRERVEYYKKNPIPWPP